MVKIRSTYWKDEELLNEAEKIRWREGKSFSEINELAMTEYVKNHKEGNSQFTLDNVIKATPAFMKPIEYWREYYNTLNENEEEDIRFKLQELIGLHYQRFGVRI